MFGVFVSNQVKKDKKRQKRHNDFRRFTTKFYIDFVKISFILQKFLHL